MPALEIPVLEITRAGAEVQAYVAADSSNGMFIAENDGTVEIEVFNDDAAPQTIEIVANPDVFNDGLTLNNLVLTIPAGETWRFGPFRPNSFKQDGGGNNLGYMTIMPSISADLYLRAFKRATARN